MPPSQAPLSAHSATGRPEPAALLAEAFEREHAQHLDGETLQSLLESLLELYPNAPVGAMTPGGIILDMPASIPVGERPVLEGGMGFDHVSAADRAGLLETWDRVLAKGAASSLLHPPGLPETRMYALDLRELHGVVFGLYVLGEVAAPSAPETSESTKSVPRFATMRKDERGQIVQTDEALTQILGWSAEEMQGGRSLDFVHPDDYQAAIDNWIQMLAFPGPARRVRQRLRRRDESWVWFEITNNNLLADPDYGCVVSEMVDISEEMAAHELLDRLAEAVPVGLFQVDPNRRIVYTNDRLHEILGMQRVDTIEEQFASVRAEDRAAIAAALDGALEKGLPADVEVALLLAGEDELRFCTLSVRALSQHDGTNSGAIACVADVTDSARMREELERRATFDELTGCYNRAAIMRELEADLASASEDAGRAVMFIDVDGFKKVNDRHGHGVGDELLRTVARCLRGAVREDDLIGRLGGDEFLLLCPNIGGIAPAMGLARRLADAVRTESLQPSDGIGCRVSIGVAWSEGCRTTADALVDQADRAMYVSKREGAGQPKQASSEPEITARRV